eukprot:1530700-Rhodomonas_salina.2
MAGRVAEAMGELERELAMRCPVLFYVTWYKLPMRCPVLFCGASYDLAMREDIQAICYQVTRQRLVNYVPTCSTVECKYWKWGIAVLVTRCSVSAYRDTHASTGRRVCRYWRNQY